MPGEVQEVTDASFEAEVLHASQPVLVDFWSPGCAPCRALAPIFEQLAREEARKLDSPKGSGETALKCVKAKVEENERAVLAYQIQRVPTLMFFRNGEPVETIQGLTAREYVIQRIEAPPGG